MSVSFTELSALDVTFLEAESPRTPMHIGAISRLEGSPLRNAAGNIRIDDIRALVADRIRTVPRFRQRLLAVPLAAGRPVWADDTDFDIARHVRVATLPPPGDPDQLRSLVETLHMDLLDRTHPLWELWLIDGLNDGSVGLLEKIHHSLVDGVSSVDVAMVLLDSTPEGRPPLSAAVAAARPAPRRGWLLARATARRAAAPLRNGVRLLASPRSVDLNRVRRLAEAVPLIFGAGWRAPRMSLNAPVGTTRRFDSVRVPMADIAETRAHLGGTVNDVVLAAVTAGLRALLESRGEAMPDAPMRALVPVSLRSGQQGLTLGNQVAGLVAPLPLTEIDPVQRFRAVHTAMEHLKGSAEAELSAILLHGAESLPQPLVGGLARLIHHQPFINLVITNVPGPPTPLYLMGARLLDSIPIVPLGGNLDVSVGIFSYAGELSIGLLADGESCSDVALLAEAIDKAFVDLRYAASRQP